jgi:EAL domain-containing protein (putative c-di-GMP-specific phosphodiesterase class I)
MASNLVSAIVGLTANVGMECVAEGVETVDQRDFLLQVGCRQLQGWLFDAALPASIAVAKVTGRDFPGGRRVGDVSAGFVRHLAGP